MSQPPKEDDQFSSGNQSILVDSNQVSPDAKRTAKKLGFATKLLGQGLLGKEAAPKDEQPSGFFLGKDHEELVNLSGSNMNTSKNEEQQGFFLGKIIEQANQIEHRKQLEEKLRIKMSSDPYVVFHQEEQNPNYPVRDDEMSFMEKFYSEHMQGMPSLPTGKCTLFCNLVCWFYFLIFGIVFLGIAGNIKQYSIDYGKQCKNQTVCHLEFDLTVDIRAPFFLYYELSEFYQSHSDFAASIMPNQMLGLDITMDQVETNCKSTKYLHEMFRNSTRLSAAGYLFDYNQIANPCGTAAKYYFNDTYMIVSPNAEAVFINETGISFEIDQLYKYKRHPKFEFRQWLDVENEHVMNWFNIQSLPLVRKLWGIIPDDLVAGKYKIIVHNNYDIDNFGGEKTIILTTLSSFGSKNFTFGIVLIVTSFLQLFSAIFIYCKHLKIEKKYQTDKKVYLDPYTNQEKEKEKQD